MTESKNKVSSLERKIEINEDVIQQLQQEILESKKLADSAHTREQKSQEQIENLRVSVTKLTDELEQKTKQLTHEERCDILINI